MRKIWCLGILFALAACGEDGGADPQHAGQPRPSSFDEFLDTGRATSGLDASELLGVVAIATSASVERSTLAGMLGRDLLVRSFAARILATQPHDSQILEAALRRLGVTPSESEASSLVQQRAQQIQIMLQQQGVDFDRAFIESQIAAQRELIQIIDESSVCRGPLTVGGSSATSGGTTPIPTGTSPLACAGFGGSSFAGGFAGTPLGRDFDETSLFTALRSSLIAQLTDASFLQSMIGTPLGTNP